MAEQQQRGAGPGSQQVDADPDDTREETFDERMDRNWAEILQELRVTQTGTQVLTGFLLAIAFQPAFTRLDPFQRGTYLALIVTAVLTTALGLAPVSLHRILFRQHAKAEVVAIAHGLLYAMLAGVALVLIGAILLIFDVVAGRTQAIVAAGTTGLVVIAMAVLPLLVRRRRGRPPQRTRGGPA